MSCYSEPDNHFGNKVKVVLDLANYATTKELKGATGVDKFNLTAKRDFIALKAEVGKLDINEFVNVPAGFSNLKTKTKTNDIEVDKLQTVPVDLKKISDVVSKKVVERIVYNKLNTKYNNLGNKIPNATILIHIN